MMEPSFRAPQDLYYRVRFKVVSQGGNTVYVLKFRTGTGTSMLDLYLSSTGKLGYRNDVAGISTISTTAPGTGAWHEAQVHLFVNGNASELEVWLDGARIDALSKTEALGTTPVGRVQLGDNSTGKTYDVALDDVAVATTFIGP